MADEVRSPLSGKERQVFETEFERLVKIHLKERAVVDLFMNHYEYLLQSAEVAKANFKSSFDGMNAGSGEFGWTLIRPEHLLGKASAAGAINTITWKKTVTTSALNSATNGWVDWIGTSTSSNQVHKEALPVIIGLGNYSNAPKSSAVKVETDERKYPVWYLETMKHSNGLNVFDIAKPFKVLPEGKIYVQAKYDVSGIDELHPLGITFAKGTYLLEKNPDLAT